MMNKLAKLIDKALERQFPFQKTFFSRLLQLKILPLPVKNALFERIVDSPSALNFPLKIDLFFLLLNSGHGSNALKLYLSFDRREFTSLCVEIRDKYQFSILRALQQDLMIDLCVEVGLQLWRVFNEEGVLEFLETEVNVLYAINPIKTGLLLHQLLSKLHKRFLNLRLELAQAISKLNALLKDLIKSINRDTLRKLILEDTDMLGRTVLSLVEPHHELIVLIQDFIQARFKYGKDGGIKLKKAPFAQHSVYHEICSTESLGKGLSYWTSKKSKGASLSMYFLFRKSIMAKYFHHWLFVLAIITFNQIALNEIIFDMIDIRAVYLGQITVNPLTMPATTPIFDGIYNRFQSFVDVYSILMSLVSFTLFTDLALLSMSRKPCKIKCGHALMLISFVIMVYSVTGIQIWLKDYNDRTYQLQGLKILDFMNFIAFSPGRDYTDAFSGAFFSNWLYLLDAIRVFQFLGILVVIISKMLIRLVPFLVLQFSVIFIFAMSAIISFYSIEKFQSLREALISLFSALLGQFDFQTMANSSTDSVIFLVAFLLINTIILLNLLIALLLQDYNDVKQNSRGYYLQQIMSLEPLWEEDEHYGVLTFKQGPLIVLNFLFIPLLYLKLKYLNKVLQIILFIPSLFLSMAIFLCFDLFYFLYSYFFIFGPIFNSPKLNSGPCARLWKGVGLFLLYPLLLVPTLLRDLVVFTINVFASEAQFQLPSEAIYTPPTITRAELHLLVSTLREILKDKTRMEAESLFVMTKDVVRLTREEAGLNLTLSGLYASVQKSPYKLQNPQTQKFESYERMKLFLWQNSFLYKEARLVYPKGLLQALLSLQMTDNVIQRPRLSKRGKGKYELNQSFNTLNYSIGMSESCDDLTSVMKQAKQNVIKGLGCVINGRMGRTKLNEGRIKILKLKDEAPALVREVDRANFWK